MLFMIALNNDLFMIGKRHKRLTKSTKIVTSCVLISLFLKLSNFL